MYERAIAGIFRVLGRLSAELQTRRVEPADDILTFLTTAEIDDQLLTEEEILKICFLMLIGGVDTSTGLLSHALAWLSQHPDQRQRLIDEPDLLPKATEEFLRWASPAPALAATRHRRNGRPAELCPGDRLLLLWGSANQDEEVFDDPDHVDLDRWPNRHQAFGLGAHRCLGSNLGRIQFQEVLMAVLTRIGDYTVDLSAAEHYPSLGQVNGYTTFPARFTPSAPTGATLP